MKLIVDDLAEIEHIEYTYLGATTTLDQNIISLDFVAKTVNIRGEFNIHGIIDIPVQLKAQYDPRSIFLDNLTIQLQIKDDLIDISKKINRLL